MVGWLIRFLIKVGGIMEDMVEGVLSSVRMDQSDQEDQHHVTSTPAIKRHQTKTQKVRGSLLMGGNSNPENPKKV